MLDLLAPAYDFYPTYIHKLVDDLPDDRLCGQPVAGVAMNHAAFLLGHLAWANDNAAATLSGGAPDFPAEWVDLFKMGSTPLPDRGRYPGKSELLGALERAHARLRAAVQNATPETLDGPTPERMRARFPTKRHMIAGLMLGHYANHVGQLSAWRRAMGFKGVF
jgi:hypothetical protein